MRCNEVERNVLHVIIHFISRRDLVFQMNQKRTDIIQPQQEENDIKRVNRNKYVRRQLRQRKGKKGLNLNLNGYKIKR
jgi:hypothetical protein